MYFAEHYDKEGRVAYISAHEIDDVTEVTQEFIDLAVGSPWFHRDGDLIILDCSNVRLVYRLTEMLDRRELTWKAQRVS